MANMDSNALIHDLATGADSTASGVVGLLGAVLALKNVDRSTFVNDIVFAFWSGESWGYVGSRKFLDDIKHFDCEEYGDTNSSCEKPFKLDLAFQKIKLPNIAAAIELNQIGNQSSQPALFIHQQNRAGDSVSNLLQSVSQNSNVATKLKPTVGSPESTIPPSSLMSFLMDNPNLPSVVITDHEVEYTNRNFHSHLDTGAFNPISNVSVCDAATLLAQTLYLLATDQTSSPVVDSIRANCSQIDILIDCLSNNFSCDFISQFLSPNRDPVPTYYTGIFGWSIYVQSISPVGVFLHDFLANITAYNFSGKTGCGKCSEDELCVANTCVLSETHYHDAISLGFDWDYSKDEWKIVNESYPLWVESNWASIGVQIFLRDDPTTEAVFLTFGLIEFVASLVAVFYAKRYFLRNYKIF